MNNQGLQMRDQAQSLAADFMRQAQEAATAQTKDLAQRIATKDPPRASLRLWAAASSMASGIVLAVLLIPALVFDSDIAQQTLGVPVFWLMQQVLYLTGNSQ